MIWIILGIYLSFGVGAAVGGMIEREEDLYTWKSMEHLIVGGIVLGAIFIVGVPIGIYNTIKKWFK